MIINFHGVKHFILELLASVSNSEGKEVIPREIQNTDEIFTFFKKVFKRKTTFEERGEKCNISTKAFSQL